MEITPSPRLNGERVGVRGFELENLGLLNPAGAIYFPPRLRPQLRRRGE
jgi:hypothetical protein